MSRGVTTWALIVAEAGVGGGRGPAADRRAEAELHLSSLQRELVSAATLAGPQRRCHLGSDRLRRAGEDNQHHRRQEQPERVDRRAQERLGSAARQAIGHSKRRASCSRLRREPASLSSARKPGGRFSNVSVTSAPAGTSSNVAVIVKVNPVIVSLFFQHLSKYTLRLMRLSRGLVK